MVNIILGTVQFGLDYGINNLSGKPGEQSIFEILEYAHSLGIHTLDTAEAYGNAVDMIGSFHRQTGSHFAINTKFTGQSVTAIEVELESNIHKLGITQVETYFYHTFSKYKANPQLADGLQKMKEAKLFKQVGISVYSNNELETAINDPGIDVIQLPFNLLDNFSQRDQYFQLAKEKQKRIQVRSVFLQGLFFIDIDKLPVKLLPLRPYLQELKSIVDKNGISMEALCLQYANQQSFVDEIVFGVDTKQQLMNNIESLHTKVSPEIYKQIDSIHMKETELLYPYNWQ